MNGAHPDLDTLADAAEGLLEPGPAAQVSEHAATCAVCAEQIASLEHVRTMLRGLPDLPMPPAVAARLETALAAVRLEPSTTPEAVSVTPEAVSVSGTVLPMDAGRRRSRRWALTIVGSAAASVVVLVAVALGIHGLGSGSHSTAANEATSLRATGTQFPAVTHSGRDYTQANLASALPELLGPAAADMSTTTSPKIATTIDGATAQSTSSAGDNEQLTACINSLDPGAIPLAVDVGTYDGKPATVIVLPGTDAARVDVWVMGSPCRADTFLLYSKLPRS